MIFFFSKLEREQIVKGYQNGTSSNELGQKFRCSGSPIRRILVAELGVEKYKKIAKKHHFEQIRKVGQLPRTQKQLDVISFLPLETIKMLNEFKTGESINKLAQKFGCSYGAMRHHLELELGKEEYKKVAKKHQAINGEAQFKIWQKAGTDAAAKKPLTKKQITARQENIKVAIEASAKTRISKQEIYFSLFLANEKVEFSHQFSIFYNDINDRKRLWSVDFFIFPNIIVQIDGVYYHCRKVKGGLLKDWYQNRELKKMGYKVLRFWDFEIENNLEKCIKKVKKKC